MLLVGRASDRNDVSGPGVGESEPLQLRVVSEEDLRRERLHRNIMKRGQMKFLGRFALDGSSGGEQELATRQFPPHRAAASRR